MKHIIQIISAPSILGLKPTGVEQLGERLLAAGLLNKLEHANSTIVNVPSLNDKYSFEREQATGCLNPLSIRDFSLVLINEIEQQIEKNTFPLVLGGDCSILLGIMPALKTKGKFGLIFLDAHADFYEPAKSTTGEVADMDLAIVTGRGPDILTNINGMKPYVNDEHAIHIGQRDMEETKKYESQDIRDSSIKCFDLKRIEVNGLGKITEEVRAFINKANLDGFWIHFDTDVLNDDENPAVDYRLPGGLKFAEAQYLLAHVLETDKITGMSVAIFNPTLDTAGEIAVKICDCISGAFNGNS